LWRTCGSFCILLLTIASESCGSLMEDLCLILPLSSCRLLVLVEDLWISLIHLISKLCLLAKDLWYALASLGQVSVCAAHDGKGVSLSRKPPNRTTEDVHLTLLRDLASKLKGNAQALGLTLSDYVAALVKGQEPIARPAAEMQDVALAGNRVVRAIGLLEADGDHAAILRLLREAQRFIAAELRKAQPAYEEAVAAQGGDDAWGEIVP
jgi:hypothetical protein